MSARGPGRPSLPRGEGRTEPVSTYVTPAEADAVSAAAGDRGLTVSAWARSTLLGRLAVVKVCPCCQRKLTHDEWCALPLLGTAIELEHRNCSCGSTITRDDPSTKKKTM